MKEVNVWQNALLSLTPGGSEFADDPARCVQFIKDYQESLKKVVAERNKLRNAMQEILDEMPSKTRLPLTAKVKEIAEQALK